jgi:hypothetical protein
VERSLHFAVALAVAVALAFVFLSVIPEGNLLLASCFLLLPLLLPLFFWLSS